MDCALCFCAEALFFPPSQLTRHWNEKKPKPPKKNKQAPIVCTSCPSCYGKHSDVRAVCPRPLDPDAKVPPRVAAPARVRSQSAGSWNCVRGGLTHTHARTAHGMVMLIQSVRIPQNTPPPPIPDPLASPSASAPPSAPWPASKQDYELQDHVGRLCYITIWRQGGVQQGPKYQIVSIVDCDIDIVALTKASVTSNTAQKKYACNYSEATERKMATTKACSHSISAGNTHSPCHFIWHLIEARWPLSTSRSMFNQRSLQGRKKYNSSFSYWFF